MNRTRGGIALVATLALVIAACGRGDDDDDAGGEQPEAPEGEAEGSITVWAMGTEGENLGVLAEDFMAEFPDVSVEVTAVPWDAAHDRIVNAIAAARSPTSASSARRGWASSPSSAASTPRRTASTRARSSRARGTPPWSTGSATACRGTSRPGSSTTAPTSPRRAASTRRRPNWDELKQLAQAQEDAGAECGISLQPGGTGSWQTFMPFFWQAGGEIVDEENAFTLDGEACVEALTYYDSFFEEGLSQPTVSDVPVEGQFADGDVGSFISGPWMIGVVTDAGADPATFTVAHQPENETATSFVGGGNFAVFEQSDNKAAAWAFVEYLTRPEVQVEVVRDRQRPAVGAGRVGRRDAGRRRDAVHVRRAARGRQVAAGHPDLGRGRLGDRRPDRTGDARRHRARRRLPGHAAGGRVDRHRAVTATTVADELASPDRAPATRRHTRKQALVGWSFALPFVLLFAVFMAGPILVSFITSFTDMRVTDIRSPLNVNFVGLDNYADVLGDPTFRKAAANTAIYVLVTVPLTIGLGLLIALGLNQGVVRLRKLFRVGFFLPYVTAIVAVAVVWRIMLGTENGLINGVLDQIGIDGPGWLTDRRYALGSIMMMTTWQGLGLQMIIFLAGLQAIPTELYEAAAVDGAGRWQKFRYVTLPSLRPTLLFSTVDRHHRPDAGLRRAVRDDPGRSARLDDHGGLPRRRPVRLRQLRLHGGGQLRAVPRHRPPDVAPVPLAAAEQVRKPDDHDDRPQSETVESPALEPAPPPKRRRPPAVPLHLALIVGLIVAAIPFVWMVLGSFKTTGELRQVPPTWIPENPTLDNYRDLFDRLDFPRYFFNSTLVAVAVTAGNLLFCSMLGYALAKLEFPGKRVLFVVVLGTLMVPAFVTFMPLFVIVSNLDLANTHAGLILPFLAGAFGVFLMRQFILGIPDELLDAARVDGAGEYTIFFRIVLPLCGPALATLGVLTFLAQLEQLPVAARGRQHGGHVHAAGGARPVRHRSAGVQLRPADGRRHGRRAADDRPVLRHAALRDPGHRHDRHQVIDRKERTMRRILVLAAPSPSPSR